MSKLKILGIRRIRKDKGFGRLTSTSYIDGKKVYNLRVDNELIKSALYDTKTKKMELEDVKTSNFVQSEKALKVKYFKKWKDEQEAKDQEYRNERFAHRLAVNGH